MGLAQSPVGDGLGWLSVTPAHPLQGAPSACVWGGREGSPCGFLSLLGMPQGGQALTVSAGSPLPASVLPPQPHLVLHVPEPRTEPCLVLVPPSPFPTSSFLGNAGLGVT